MSKAYRTYGIEDMTKTNVDMAEVERFSYSSLSDTRGKPEATLYSIGQRCYGRNRFISLSLSFDLSSLV